MSYIAITSNQTRHRAFIERIQKKVDLSLVISVAKKPGNPRFLLSERLLLKQENWSPINCSIVECTPHQVNSKRMSDMIRDFNPKVCFVFGAPLLKSRIFNIPSQGAINIHTGLVQHHRGVDSPYWAIHEGKAETIGATLHYIDDSIDGGNIIDQSQTKNLHIHDQPEDIFMKTCITGFDILDKNMYNILNNTVEPYPLDKRGKLYQTKDMCYGTMLEIRYKTPYLLKEYLNGNNS